MPEISRFFGLVVQMYFEDHAPPHFHVRYAGANALIRIAPVGLLRGHLPPRALALAIEWANLREAELMVNWQQLRRGHVPSPIPPLE